MHNPFSTYSDTHIMHNPRLCKMCATDRSPKLQDFHIFRQHGYGKGEGGRGRGGSVGHGRGDDGGGGDGSFGRSFGG